MHQNIETKFNNLKERNLSIDITRGKPDRSQLDLSNELIDISIPSISEDGIDLRNYGEPFGIKEARKEPTPWKDLKNPKFICPVPGFDRHFMMLDDFGIEAVGIPLNEDGIDLDAFKNLLQNDDNFVGILCVPKHSNPSGEIYSDTNLEKMFEIGSDYSDKFLFLFDHAYLIHDFLPTPEQMPLWEVAVKMNVQNQTVITTSFSKVTFGGGGISFIATAGHSLELIKKVRTTMIICPDKLNQKRHVEFFKNAESVKKHMQKHAELVRPKFEIAYYSTTKPIATKVVELCKELGVLITPAGSTFPNNYDPNDSVIRLAPTYVSKDELEDAMEVFTTSIQIAHFDIKV